MTQIILSSNQTHRLHHQFYTPKGEIYATLLIVHGMSEHSGRYDAFAKFLAEHGILVATYDQLGHGKTAKDKYELGFFDEKHPVQTLCKDVIIMANALKQTAHTLKADSVPHFIMGHSMGSFLVRTVLTHHATSFDGVILMGTGANTALVAHFARPMLAFANQYRPKQQNMALATFLNNYLLNKISSPLSPSPFAWLSENSDAIKAFEADPLTGFAFSNNGFYALQALMDKATTTAWYQHMRDNYPILLISGKDDPVGDMSQAIIDLQDDLVSAGKTAVQVQLYPNMRHEILHEKAALSVYHDILMWINKQIKLIEKKES